MWILQYENFNENLQKLPSSTCDQEQKAIFNYDNSPVVDGVITDSSVADDLTHGL